MEKLLNKIAELLYNTAPQDTAILSHPDHDGITATVLIDIYFLKYYGKRCEKIFYPTRDKPYYAIFQRLLREKPKILFILDALVGKYKNFLKELLNKGTMIVNMDHHDVVNIRHNNYINVNPHIWGIEYLNTSSLVWQMLRKIDRDYFDERCWLAGIGSVQDYCYHDNLLLFKTMYEMGISNILKYEDIFDSKLMKYAKMINATCRYVGYEYTYLKVLKAGITNSSETLLRDDKMMDSYNKYKKELAAIYDKFCKTHYKYPYMNMIAYRHNEKARPSLIAEICEMDKKPLIYFGYYKGVVGFCSLFFDYDVRKLAQLFNGSGPHPKIGGGKTKKSFEEVIDLISKYLSHKQHLLNDFFNH